MPVARARKICVLSPHQIATTLAILNEFPLEGTILQAAATLDGLRFVPLRPDFVSFPRQEHSPVTSVECDPIIPALNRTGIDVVDWLAQAADALFSDNGTPVARVTGGASNRHVGHEFGVVLSYKISKQYRFGFGYGYLWAGPFLKQATAHSNVSYPYSFLTYSF